MKDITGIRSPFTAVFTRRPESRGPNLECIEGLHLGKIHTCQVLYLIVRDCCKVKSGSIKFFEPFFF